MDINETQAAIFDKAADDLTATQVAEQQDRERQRVKVLNLNDHYGGSARRILAAAALEIAKQAGPPPLLVEGDLADIEARIAAGKALDAAMIGVDFAAPGVDGTAVTHMHHDEQGNLVVDEVHHERRFLPPEPVVDATVPLRSPEYYSWRDRQNIQTPKPRQLFVSKGTEVDFDGNIRTYTRTARATQPDMFDTKRCKLSKRQAKKLRKESQREIAKLGVGFQADGLTFNK